MISSVLILGSLLGTLVAATFGMAYGRRTWVQMGNVLEIIGALISATSYGPGQMIAGRVITVAPSQIGIGSRPSKKSPRGSATALLSLWLPYTLSRWLSKSETVVVAPLY